jgi:hypothetical protein
MFANWQPLPEGFDTQALTVDMVQLLCDSLQNPDRGGINYVDIWIDPRTLTAYKREAGEWFSARLS